MEEKRFNPEKQRLPAKKPDGSQPSKERFSPQEFLRSPELEEAMLRHLRELGQIPPDKKNEQDKPEEAKE